MPQARDEAGNIWETDPQGNALRLVRAAGAPAIGGVPFPSGGADAGASDVTRYSEGQRLRGSDGKTYRMQGGIPVLEAANIPGGVVIRPADPMRPAQIRKGNNEASASDYDPARARNDVRQGDYTLGIQPTKDRRSLTDDIAKRYTADPAVRKYSEAASSYARAERAAHAAR